MEHKNNVNLDDQLSDIADNFGQNLNIEEQRERNHEKVDEEDEEIEIVVDDDEDGGEFEFAFAGGEVSSPVSAEEVFRDGKIRPLFPFRVEDAAAGEEDASSYGPPVRKVFVIEDDDVAEGPYCVWSSEEDKKTAAETAAPDMSKKSNSTGFSKLWRVKDLLVRSNSDGRDAFVFLHKKEAAGTAAPSAAEVKKERKVSLRRLRIGGESSTAAAGGDGGEKKVKKEKKPATATTAYEALYGGNEKKKKGGKSYLPYRQDLVGFFTNSNGMTRNVHPY